MDEAWPIGFRGIGDDRELGQAQGRQGRKVLSGKRVGQGQQDTGADPIEPG